MPMPHHDKGAPVSTPLSSEAPVGIPTALSRGRQLTKEHQAQPIRCSLSPEAGLLSLARKETTNTSTNREREPRH